RCREVCIRFCKSSPSLPWRKCLFPSSLRKMIQRSSMLILLSNLKSMGSDQTRVGFNHPSPLAEIDETLKDSNSDQRFREKNHVSIGRRFFFLVSSGSFARLRHL